MLCCFSNLYYYELQNNQLTTCCKAVEMNDWIHFQKHCLIRCVPFWICYLLWRSRRSVWASPFGSRSRIGNLWSHSCLCCSGHNDLSVCPGPSLDPTVCPSLVPASLPFPSFSLPVSYPFPSLFQQIPAPCSFPAQQRSPRRVNDFVSADPTAGSTAGSTAGPTAGLAGCCSGVASSSKDWCRFCPPWQHPLETWGPSSPC